MNDNVILYNRLELAKEVEIRLDFCFPVPSGWTMTSRTIKHYIDSHVLQAPLGKGSTAKYNGDHAERVVAIRSMAHRNVQKGQDPWTLADIETSVTALKGEGKSHSSITEFLMEADPVKLKHLRDRTKRRTEPDRELTGRRKPPKLGELQDYARYTVGDGIEIQWTTPRHPAELDVLLELVATAQAMFDASTPI